VNEKCGRCNSPPGIPCTGLKRYGQVHKVRQKLADDKRAAEIARNHDEHAAERGTWSVGFLKSGEFTVRLNGHTVATMIMGSGRAEERARFIVDACNERSEK
jgi:hypothetical protein